MRNDEKLPFRWFAGWLGFLLGMFLGWGAVELSWLVHHPHGVHLGWGAPVRGLDYYLLAAASSLAGGVAGLGIARFSDLPREDDPTNP